MTSNIFAIFVPYFYINAKRKEACLIDRIFPSHSPLFNYDTSRDNIHQCNREKSYYGNNRVSHNMAAQHLPAAVSAAVSRANIVLRHLANHAASKELNNHSAFRHSNCQCRKNEIAPETRGALRVLDKISRGEEL